MSTPLWSSYTDLHGTAVRFLLSISFCHSDVLPVTVGIFSRFLPLASTHGIRIVLVNRRDYPGSSPFTDEQRRRLHRPLSDGGDSQADIELYMKEQAQDLYEFMGTFVREENLAPRSMIIGGWSFGSAWITTLLAYTSSINVQDGSDISLGEYVKCMLLYDMLSYFYSQYIASKISTTVLTKQSLRRSSISRPGLPSSS